MANNALEATTGSAPRVSIEPTFPQSTVADIRAARWRRPPSPTSSIRGVVRLSMTPEGEPDYAVLPALHYGSPVSSPVVRRPRRVTMAMATPQPAVLPPTYEESVVLSRPRLHITTNEPLSGGESPSSGSGSASESPSGSMRKRIASIRTHVSGIFNTRMHPDDKGFSVQLPAAAMSTLDLTKSDLPAHNRSWSLSKSLRARLGSTSRPPIPGHDGASHSRASTETTDPTDALDSGPELLAMTRFNQDGTTETRSARHQRMRRSRSFSAFTRVEDGGDELLAELEAHLDDVGREALRTVHAINLRQAELRATAEDA
uniref:Uncharacterized protein n=1 Tax=Mycena chlorophos TaxID=658473 RepID=A0ABQ0L016_MYCCL|nr:predicted protein [Mycena chlorophos]